MTDESILGNDYEADETARVIDKVTTAVVQDGIDQATAERDATVIEELAVANECLIEMVRDAKARNVSPKYLAAAMEAHASNLQSLFGEGVSLECVGLEAFGLDGDVNSYLGEAEYALEGFADTLARAFKAAKDATIAGFNSVSNVLNITDPAPRIVARAKKLRGTVENATKESAEKDIGKLARTVHIKGQVPSNLVAGFKQHTATVEAFFTSFLPAVFKNAEKMQSIIVACERAPVSILKRADAIRKLPMPISFASAAMKENSNFMSGFFVKGPTQVEGSNVMGYMKARAKTSLTMEAPSFSPDGKVKMTKKDALALLDAIIKHCESFPQLLKSFNPHPLDLEVRPYIDDGEEVLKTAAQLERTFVAEGFTTPRNVGNWVTAKHMRVCDSLVSVVSALFG